MFFNLSRCTGGFSISTMRVAMLAPISWRVPPRHYGPWEQFVSLLTEGLVARGLDVTLFATADSETYPREELAQARELAKELPPLVEAERYLALVELVPPNSIGTPRREIAALRAVTEPKRPTLNDELAWLRTATGLREPARQYLSLAVDCAFLVRAGRPGPTLGSQGDLWTGSTRARDVPAGAPPVPATAPPVPTAASGEWPPVPPPWPGDELPHPHAAIASDETTKSTRSDRCEARIISARKPS